MIGVVAGGGANERVRLIDHAQPGAALQIVPVAAGKPLDIVEADCLRGVIVD